MDKVGKKAPDFQLEDQDGKTHSLADYKGKKLLMYFYPKDMTPGCTVEAQSFRDNIKELRAKNVEVLGISCDSTSSHKKFCDKENLNFPLLADIEKKTVNDYGVWQMGIQRDSFLIDENGKVLKHYEKVKPAEHVAEILKDVSGL